MINPENILDFILCLKDVKMLKMKRNRVEHNNLKINTDHTAVVKLEINTRSCEASGIRLLDIV